MTNQLSRLLDSRASNRQRRAVVLVLVLATLLSVIVAPFSHLPFESKPAFLPSFLTALLFTKGLTSYLLFLHYFSVRRLSMGILASVYLFISCRLFVGLYYVGDPLFDLHGFWGLWHSYSDPGVMLAILCYRLWGEKPLRPVAVRRSLFFLVTLPVFLVFLVTYRIVTGRASLLLFLSRSFLAGTPHLYLFAFLASLLALLVIWWLTRLRSVLHLWLAVVTYVSLINTGFMLFSRAEAGSLGWHLAMLTSLLSSMGLAFVLLRELQHSYLNVQFANNVLWVKSMRDELTGLYNRRYMNEELSSAMRHLHAEGGALAMILIDVDHFKQINDRFGHAEGDICLAQLARILRRMCRFPSGFIARYGGEEFAIVLPGVSQEEAGGLAESIRAEVGETVLRDDVYLSISAGVALWRAQDGPDEGRGLMRRADLALYAAKERGRNQVVLYLEDSLMVGFKRKEM
jgi:diguanylate cyclase (GGDEF)-like protein